jgi:hypothetical protein
LQNFAKRLQALESRQPHKQTEEEKFLERLPTPELKRLVEIFERTDDGRLPLTVEEKRFVDDLEAKYGSDRA